MMEEKLSEPSRLGSAFNRCNFPLFCSKPFQVKCFEYLLKGKYIVAVLLTGFGKSLLFQLLPDFLPVKAAPILCKIGLTTLTTSTVRDICTCLAVFLFGHSTFLSLHSCL